MERCSLHTIGAQRIYLTDKNPARINTELFKPCCFLLTLPAMAVGNEESVPINKSPELHLLSFLFKLPQAMQSGAGFSADGRAGSEANIFMLVYMLR